MKYEKLQNGMVLYQTFKTRMGNTLVKTVIVYAVKIVELLPERRGAMASCNGNPPTYWGEKSLAKLKKDQPVMVKNFIGSSRLETAKEKKDRLAKELVLKVENIPGVSRVGMAFQAGKETPLATLIALNGLGIERKDAEKLLSFWMSERESK
ncbi:MAG: hypothetical protein WC511_02205 [Candidatus Pacearchaeota archaeon]